MTTPDPRPSWRATLAAVGLVVVAHAATLLFPLAARLHPEEAVNATHALLLAHDPPWLGVGLQYKDFCGGCTVDAWLGWLSFAVLGRSVLAWKLVPLAFTGLLAGAGFRLLRGGLAGWAFALLLAAPPGQLGGAFTTGWGNHLESTALVVAALAVLGPTAGRAATAGALAGVALVVSPGAAWGALAAALLVGRRGLPAYLGGAAAPIAAGWGFAVAAGRDPSVVVRYGGHGTGADAGVLGGLSTLVDPEVLAVLLGRPAWVAVPAGLGLVVAVAWLGRVRDEPGRRIGVGLACWLLAYLLSPFRITATMDVLGRPWFGARYAVPLLVLVLLAVASLVGRLTARSRTAAAFAVAALVPSSLAGRLAAFDGPARVDRLGRDPVDAEDWLRRLGPRDAPWLATLACADPACATLHDFGRGFEAARAGTPWAGTSGSTGYAWGFGRGDAGCATLEAPTAASLSACADRLAVRAVPAGAMPDAVDGATFDTPLEAPALVPGTPVDAGTLALARARGFAWAWSLATEGPFAWPDLDGVDPALARAFAGEVGRRAGRLYGDEVKPPPPEVAEAFTTGALAAR